MRGWCRARLASPGSSAREWQDFVVDTVEGQAKTPTDRICVEKFVHGLHNLSFKMPQLCRLGSNLSTFMYTRGQLTGEDGRDSVEVDTVLWNTSNGATSCLSESFFNANEEALTPMTDRLMFIGSSVQSSYIRQHRQQASSKVHGRHQTSRRHQSSTAPIVVVKPFTAYVTDPGSSIVPTVDAPPVNQPVSRMSQDPLLSHRSIAPSAANHPTPQEPLPRSSRGSVSIWPTFSVLLPYRAIP